MFMKWQEAFESFGLEINLGKTKVVICDGITKDGLSKSKVHPCGVCILRVKTNSFCVYIVVNGSMVDVPV